MTNESYGTWMIMKACNDNEIVKHVTCGIHYHPAVSLIEKDIFHRDDIELCTNCNCPQLIHATKNEPSSWKPNGIAHTTLQENKNVEEVQFTNAPNNQSHGFMTRVDMNIEHKF